MKRVKHVIARKIEKQPVETHVKKVETIEDLDALYKKALDGLPAQDKMSVTVDRKGRELHFILKYREDTEKDDLQ